MTNQGWLTTFAASARGTDHFIGNADHAALLAAGLMGETGSIISELKKEEREQGAYPASKHRMVEEIGDFLWYFVRLVSALDPNLLKEFEASSSSKLRTEVERPLSIFLSLGHSVGRVLECVRRGTSAEEARPVLRDVWAALIGVARDTQIDLQEAAIGNIRKVESRWPSDRVYSPLFDEGFPEEERLPRHLEIEFKERSQGAQRTIILKCNGISFGDRLTDNIKDPDGYRYHDIFHFAHVVHLGWSPVVRALLRCKRKSRPEIDEGEDGARAVILEEAVAAAVFSRAKHLRFFDGMDHVDFGLLKMVREFVLGYEVERVPLWQWESAILDGYRVFRDLSCYRGGRLTLDLEQRQLKYSRSQ